MEEEKPLAAWRGFDRIDDTVLPSQTIILKTGGCSWNRCRMCSYRHERYGPIAAQELEARLLSQLDWVAKYFPVQESEIIKIYTSGSFFDPEEVPPAVWERAGTMFQGKIVIAETRPEYVKKETVEEFIHRIDDGSRRIPLFVAVGLETSSDAVRDKCIQKGFSWNDFLSAVGEARSAGAGIKAYLLAKPLFLTENEAVSDMISSVRDLNGHADLISMNPCTVQRGTELEWYWKRGEFRPPYLWSILTILKAAHVHVSCDPVGGGRERGPHNCGSCDRPLVTGIREYSLSADRALLDELLESGCPCRDEWKMVLDEERPYCMPLTR